MNSEYRYIVPSVEELKRHEELNRKCQDYVLDMIEKGRVKR